MCLSVSDIYSIGCQCESGIGVWGGAHLLIYVC